MKSYKEIAEALKGNQHKIDKNKNGKIDAHDFKLLRKEEAEQLEEGLDPSEVASNPKMYDAATVKKAYYHKSTSAADKEYLAKHLDRHHGNKEWRKPVKEEAELTEATVKTQKYSWGTMKTVHHGADFSIPLHPEHHQAIAKLKDNQEHKFKDETGRHWTAKRMGDDVHFQGANNGGTTKVKHADLKESEDRMARADYKVSPSGRKSHSEIVFKNSDDDEDEKKKEEMKEAAPPGFEGTVKAMKKKKEIDNPYALAWSMYKKGYKSHKNPDGTMKEESEIEEQAPVAPVPDRKYIKGTPEHKAYMATKKPRVGHPTNVKEEAEELEERNKENAIKRKMMDASRGARFKAQGNYVPDAEPQHKTAQAHNKAIGRAIRQMSNEEVEQVTEGMMTTHQDPLVTVHDKHGLHTHANLSTANNIFGTKVKHTDVHAGAVNTKSRDGTALKFAISQHHAQAVKDEEKFKKQFGESKLSYKEFMEAMTATQVRPGVTRYTGGSYGSAKGAKYGNTDYDKETLDTKDDEGNDQQKRGRGRPAGAKSGARGPRIK